MAGGGIGEAALIGAAVGGGTALLTGRDPLKGALLGGITGGAGGALMGAGAGAAGSLAGETVGPTVAGASGAGAIAGETAGAGVGGALSGASPTFGYTASGISPFATETVKAALPNTITPAAIEAATVPSAGSLVPVRDLANSAYNLNGGIAANVGSGAGSSMLDDLGKWYGGLSTPGKIGVGIGGGLLLNSLMNRPQMPDAMSMGEPSFNYDWRKFRPSLPYAEGGIVALAQGGLQNRYVSGMGPLDQNMQNVPNPREVANPSSGYLNPSVQMMAHGGIASLGGYSDGGRLLKGPGDGMSDHIPATIGNKQPARLADGEFVVPADVVSHLGNGSTDAGAKQLYAMMNRVRKARTGRSSQGKQINAKKHMVA